MNRVLGKAKISSARQDYSIHAPLYVVCPRTKPSADHAALITDLQEALDLALALISKFALGSTDEALNLALGEVSV